MKKAISGILALFIAAALVSCRKSGPSVDPAYKESILESLSRLRVGDWVLYYLSPQVQVRMQVVEKKDDIFTIEYLTYLSSSARSIPTKREFSMDGIKRNLERGMDIYGARHFVEMKSEGVWATIDEKTYDATHWIIKTDDGVFLEQWLSKDVPLFGMILQNRNNEMTLAIRASGWAGEKIDWPKGLTPLTGSAEIE